MKYQSIIYQIGEDITPTEIKNLQNQISETGNIFFIAENIKNEKGFISVSILDFTETIINAGLHFVNIIVVPQSVKYDLSDNIKYLLWFTKDINKIFFNKDAIREKHIWKDVEWGKRKKNYNEKGKDPGNVWIPTNDNGKGSITEHIILSDNDIIDRIIKSTTKQNDNTLIEHYNLKINKKGNNIKIIEKDSYKNQKKTDTKKTPVKEGKNTKKQNIIHFDTSENMYQIKDECIDMMVTSPPYWDLKNYYKKGQIGQESYQEYLDRLEKVWKETYRVLKDTGSMWININTRTKNKKPILIPQDIIKQCKKNGFYLKDIIIWHKSSSIPTHKNNLTDRFEYFLWFTKSENYFINNDYIKKINDYKNTQLNKGVIWNINRKAGSVGKNFVHPAIYPVKLIERIINLNSKNHDTILDPFLGSGTTLISAIINNRYCIGYEYNEEFIPLIKYRMNKEHIIENVDFQRKIKPKQIIIKNNFKQTQPLKSIYR